MPFLSRFTALAPRGLCEHHVGASEISINMGNCSGSYDENYLLGSGERITIGEQAANLHLIVGGESLCARPRNDGSFPSDVAGNNVPVRSLLKSGP